MGDIPIVTRVNEMFWFFGWFFCFLFMALGFEHRAPCIPGKHFSTELPPQALLWFLMKPSWPVLVVMFRSLLHGVWPKVFGVCPLREKNVHE